MTAPSLMPVLSRSAAIAKLVLRRGDTFRVRLTLRDKTTKQPKDLTGYSGFLGQVRANAEATEVLATILVTLLDAVGGVLELLITADDTALFETATMKSASFDIQWTEPNGDTWTFIKGPVELESDVAHL